MNTTVAGMQKRGSVRKYNSQKAISQEIISNIVKAVQQSPTYICGQQYSIILVDDLEKRKKLVELTMPSSNDSMSFIQEAPIFLLFVMDFNKIHIVLEEEKSQMEITEYLEGLLIGSVDVGIGLEAATVAAESYGLSTVVIGAVRKSVKEIIELFSLPKYTFPLVGLCIGYADEKTEIKVKPRLALSSFVHNNEYSLDEADFKKNLHSYNNALSTFYSDDAFKWTEFVAHFYGRAYWTKLSSLYKEQGFNLK